MPSGTSSLMSLTLMIEAAVPDCTCGGVGWRGCGDKVWLLPLGGMCEVGKNVKCGLLNMHTYCSRVSHTTSQTGDHTQTHTHSLRAQGDDPSMDKLKSKGGKNLAKSRSFKSGAGRRWELSVWEH